MTMMSLTHLLVVTKPIQMVDLMLGMVMGWMTANLK
jgi:hypothetical protein